MPTDSKTPTYVYSDYYFCVNHKIRNFITRNFNELICCTYCTHSHTDLSRQTKSQETSTMTTTNSGTITTPMAGSGQNHVGSQISQDDAPMHKMEETSKSEGTQAGGTLQHGTLQHGSSKQSTGTGTRTKDYNDEMVGDMTHHISTFTLLNQRLQRFLNCHPDFICSDFLGSRIAP